MRFHLLLLFGFTAAVMSADRPVTNVLIFTADDLGCESVSCFGGLVKDLTPNLDQFAQQGMRFAKAHVTNAICQPSRGVIATGLYSYRSGITGFYHTNKPIPTIMEQLRAAGRMTGILGKVEHSTPKAEFKWDYEQDQKELGNGRSPTIYHDRCVEFLNNCKKAGKPFYFMVNSHDPHRPWFDGNLNGGAMKPSKIYTPEDVPVPGYLPDLPGVRQELSQYLSSVRRLDDTFGAVMQALSETGYEKTTLVIFLSDNGMAVPFAKCNAYYASTRTPLLVRHPGLKAGGVDDQHYINEIDIFPTVLDALGLPGVTCDGESFLPFLKGDNIATWRTRIFTEIDEQAGGGSIPMRCVQDGQYAYIFNAWSDGVVDYHNNNEGASMKAMEQAAKTDPTIAARVALFRYRVVEELYDLEKDPSGLHNLINAPEHSSALATLRGAMEQQMVSMKDPLLKAFTLRNGSSAERSAAYQNIYPKQKGKPGKE